MVEDRADQCAVQHLSAHPDHGADLAIAAPQRRRSPVPGRTCVSGPRSSRPGGKSGSRDDDTVRRTRVKQATTLLTIRTAGRGMVDITRAVQSWLGDQSIAKGLMTVFCTHTSASLLIQENAAPEVRSDLEAFFERIAPEDPNLYDHDDEGPDDMPAHLRTALTQVQLSIPVLEGRAVLGPWQGVYLFEHRVRPH